jgi:predicted N-acyltransferase
MLEAPRLEMTVHHRLDSVDLPRWDAIRDPDNLLTDASYLRAVEEARLERAALRYVEFRQNGRLLLTMTGSVLVNDLVMFTSPVLERAASVVRMLVPAFLKRNTMEIGPLLGVGTSISHVRGVTRDQWRDAVAQVKEHARARRVELVLFRDFAGSHPVEPALLDAGFVKFFNLPLATMNIPWDSFDGYLRALKRARRSDVLAKMRRKREHGIRTVITNDGLGLLHRYNELYDNVSRRSKRFNRDGVGDNYHRSMSRNMRRCSYWLQYFQGDALVAFSHVLRYGNQLSAQFIGLDYDVSTRARLYFNMYFDLLQFAFDNGLHRFDAGITSCRAKSAIGFSVVPQVMYAWMSNRATLRVAAGLWNRMTSYDLAGCTLAFKDPALQNLWDGRTR